MAELISARQIGLMFGMSSLILRRWVSCGELNSVGGKYDPSMFVEGYHYITCQECQQHMAAITPLHLKKHGMVLSDYKAAHPTFPTECELTMRRRVRTPETKAKQRASILNFWNSEDGIECRKSHSQHRKRENAENPELRETRLKNLERRNTTIPKLLSSSPNENSKKWHRENKERSDELAALARQNNITTSQLHLDFKAALSPYVQTETEFKKGPYSIDEAIPDRQIAIEVDGCYWHGCESCGFPGVYPKGTDAKKTSFLNNRGWTLIRVKGCEFRKDPAQCVSSVLEVINGVA